MKVGDKLRQLRTDNNLTLRELHDKTGISVSFISDIENKRRNPSIDKLKILCAALGVSINEFFNNVETGTPVLNTQNNDKNNSSEQQKFRDTIAAHLDDKELTPKKVKLIQDYIEALFDDED